jgi:hypothetical protein
MKMTALRKEILLLILAGLIIASLISYIIPSLLAGDHKSHSVSRLNEVLSGLISQSQNNWMQKKGKTVNLEKEVNEPLTLAETILSELYEGKISYPNLQSEGVEFKSPHSEDQKALIKLSIVALEKLKEQIAAGDEKTESQFGIVRSSIQSVVKEYKDQAVSSRKWLVSMSWVTLFLTVAFIAAIIILTYMQSTRFQKQLTASQSKVVEESMRVDQLSGFIEAMASGNYDMQIEAKADDELTATLISMRDKLKGNFVEEQRRNWSTTGLAKIGEILRSTGNSTELYDNIIKFLVKYTNSNQGGLFILDDSEIENPMLDLVACYAFERKKFLTKRVSVGSGLVGQCFLEAERIHLTEIPEDYIRITSGLGGERPASCLLVPLKVNDKIFGVIELASFKFYAEHVVELVEKFAESIASTISNVKINESTKILLEQTQQQAEEMKSQEEEMRQNMEELSATQEEMHRKEQEYIKRISDLESELSIVEKG